MNEMRKLMETVNQLTEARSKVKMVTMKKMQKLGYADYDELPGQYTDWKAMFPETLAQVADEVAQYGLTVYMLDDNDHDGYFWWIAK